MHFNFFVHLLPPSHGPCVRTGRKRSFFHARSAVIHQAVRRDRRDKKKKESVKKKKGICQPPPPSDDRVKSIGLFADANVFLNPAPTISPHPITSRRFPCPSRVLREPTTLIGRGAATHQSDVPNRRLCGPVHL